LDEIQNLPGWHRWLNRLYEFEDVKLFITGSNSSMMKGEAAMSLTGRNRVITLHPFSFREYAAACGVTWTERDLLTGEGKAKLARLFGQYVREGGFPENVRRKDPDILRHYFGDIVYRDIVARYGLRNVREIRELALYLASNLSSLASYKKLKDAISVNSLTTVKNYLGYFADVYLFFPVNLFEYSLKRQMYNPAKIYCVDHALAAAMAFKFSSDSGRILENIVCGELKRRGCDIYYWKDKNGREVDFLIRQGQEITAALQVCQDISADETRKREISGALSAAATFSLPEVKILTADQEGEEILKGVRILYEPLWRWLIGKVGTEPYFLSEK
jgi:predicted AAA+ superfamily ATPase